MRNIHPLSLNAFLAVLALTTANAGFAWDCRRIPPKEALQSSAVVFHGVAINIEHLRTMNAPDPVTGQSRRWIPELDDLIVVTFQVDAFWKGPATPFLKVYSIARPSMCDGYEFSIAKESLVYAIGPPAPDQLGPAEREVVARFKKEPVYQIPTCPPPILPGTLPAATAVLGKGRIVKEQH